MRIPTGSSRPVAMNEQLLTALEEATRELDSVGVAKLRTKVSALLASIRDEKRKKEMNI